MPEHSPRSLVAAAHRGLNRALAARFTLRALAWCVAALALAVLAGAFLPLAPSGAWVRTLALVLAAVAATAAMVARFRRESPSLATYLERVEGRFPAVRSWLRNALELDTTPPNTSTELAQALVRETARRVADVPLAELAPRLEARRPGAALAVAALALAVLAVVVPARSARSWRTLADPNAAAPPVRLVVEPGSVRLSPGASLAVRARVWGSNGAPRLLRSGERPVVAVAEGRTDDGARTWRFDLAQLTHEQDYRVRVASVESPRYRIALAGMPMPVSFDIEYRAPGYARLPVQRGAATRGDLTALRGTRARLVVTFDRDLASLDAHLPDGRDVKWSAVTPRRWQGDVPIDRAGEYALRAVARTTGATPGEEGRCRYAVNPLPDAPPVLTVALPTGDQDLPAGQQIALDAQGEDDLGLTELKLQHRRDPNAPWTDVPLSRFEQAPREAHVATRWDASGLALLPGQSATFRLELFDNNAIGPRGVAVSAPFELRFPSLAEMYEKLDHKQAGAQAQLEKAAEQARDLQKALDKLSRQVQPPPGQTPRAFERSEEMKSALQRQQEMSQKMDEAAQQLRESLEQAAERRAFDEQLARKLKEVGELMEQVRSEEFKEAVRKMQDALENMDRHAMEQNLPEWKQRNQEMLANLERTLDLLKKMRAEEKLQALAQRADDLKQRQDALNREHEEQDARDHDAKSDAKSSDEQSKSDADKKAQRESLTDAQKKAAEESEKLAKETRDATDQAKPQDAQEWEQSAKQLNDEAAPEQRDAAESQNQQDAKKAAQSGKKASQALQQVADRMRKSAQQQQAQQSELDLAAVRRAAQDLVTLQRSSERAQDPNVPLNERADLNTDLSEGTSRVADSLFTLARKTPFISPRLAQALGRAISQLAQSGRNLSGGNRARAEESGHSAGQSLNEAVLELRAAEQSMCQQPGSGSPGQQPGSQTSAEKMEGLGQRQGEVNQESRTLAKRLSEQMRLSTGDRDELNRLAQEQQRIREALEEIKRSEENKQQLLGRLDQTQKEMKEVEEALRQGEADGSMEEKQTRILSRMLDAQRSLNRRDFDPERESRAGEDLARSSPAELPKDLLRENDRLRLGLLKAEADRYPAQYRSLIEAYLKSLNGSPR